jgi:hypothetical protein
MVHVELTPEQAGTLAEILGEYLSDLRMEIAGTDEMGFREGLKQREVFLKDLLTRLGA